MALRPGNHHPARRHVDDFKAATARAARLAHAILDGTLILIDRVADQKPYYSRKTQTPRREHAGPSPTRPVTSSGRRPRCPVPPTT